ncbi:MAG TPA: GNAT family N-acetyltransferase [Chloroflexota bacterium]
MDANDHWIDKILRGQGYGSQLLQRPEADAQKSGCRHVEVFTYSFQAPGFYQKEGYRVVGRMDDYDYPPGESLLWLRKDLS